MARWATRISIIYAVASVLIFLLGILGIAFATDGHWWGWALLLLFTIAFFTALALVGSASRLALLWKRGARIGRVTRFNREEAPLAVRGEFSRPKIADDEVVENTWWDADEKFEEMLRHYAGHEPSWIELLGEDDVLYSVEGTPVKKVHDVRCVSI